MSENLVGGVKTPWDPFSPREGVERSAPLPGDFRVIVGPTPPQMDDFCDLLGTPYPPVSRIVTVKIDKEIETSFIYLGPKQEEIILLRHHKILYETSEITYYYQTMTY